MKESEMSNQPPAYDAQGLNVLDHHDRRGVKSKYITLLQEMAIKRYLPEPVNNRYALDVGCGYGRLTATLAAKGWNPIGIDPAYLLLSYARRHNPTILFCQAQLPDLPVKPVGMILLQNVLRVLLLNNALSALTGIERHLSPSGKLVVVENIRNHPNYFQVNSLVTLLENRGFQLQQTLPIRFGRWWMLYLIRYGLIPEKWLPRIAEYELSRAKRWRGYLPPWQYLNVLSIFSPNRN